MLGSTFVGHGILAVLYDEKRMKIKSDSADNWMNCTVFLPSPTELTILNSDADEVYRFRYKDCRL